MESFKKQNGVLIVVTGRTPDGKKHVKEMGKVARLMAISDGQLRIQSPDVDRPTENGFWSSWISIEDISFRSSQ